MKNKNLINVTFKDQLIAKILKKDFKEDGIHFLTPGDFSQQLGYMNRPKGYKIPAHVHKLHLRSVTYTLETIFVKSGKVKVDFYTDDKKFVESQILETGDTLFIASGGHGFTMLEPTEMIEVKQGPYFNDQDKEVFEPKNDK